jgi:glycosyltransferase involved in cell wall biosynthesis
VRTPTSGANQLLSATLDGVYAELRCGKLFAGVEREDRILVENATESVMDVSLVVCTRDRAGQLSSALTSFAQLVFQGAWELVIVDNGSQDDTPRILKEFARDFKGNVRLLQEANPGLARARNLGWRTANGQVIVFTDDDCYPQADLLEQAARAFAEERLGFIGGKVLLHDPEDLPVTIQTLDRRLNFRPRSFIPTGTIHGANFAFRRRVLEQIGGFDERFGAGTRLFAAEDTDALARTSAAGWWGAYQPTCVVSHHHRRRGLAELKKLQRGYYIGVGAYFIKCILNPRLCLKYLLRWPLIMRRAGLRAAFWHVKGAVRLLTTRNPPRQTQSQAR